MSSMFQSQQPKTARVRRSRSRGGRGRWREPPLPFTYSKAYAAAWGVPYRKPLYDGETRVLDAGAQWVAADPPVVAPHASTRTALWLVKGNGNGDDERHAHREA